MKLGKEGQINSRSIKLKAKVSHKLKAESSSKPLRSPMTTSADNWKKKAQSYGKHKEVKKRASSVPVKSPQSR